MNFKSNYRGFYHPPSPRSERVRLASWWRSLASGESPPPVNYNNFVVDNVDEIKLNRFKIKLNPN